MAEIRVKKLKRTTRVQYAQGENVLDIAYVNKTGRTVVSMGRKGEIPAVVSFENLDDLHNLVDSLYRAVPGDIDA